MRRHLMPVCKVSCSRERTTQERSKIDSYFFDVLRHTESGWEICEASPTFPWKESNHKKNVTLPVVRVLWSRLKPFCTQISLSKGGAGNESFDVLPFTPPKRIFACDWEMSPDLFHELESKSLNAVSHLSYIKHLPAPHALRASCSKTRRTHVWAGAGTLIKIDFFSENNI